MPLRPASISLPTFDHPGLDTAWKSEAACRGTDTTTFFPDKGGMAPTAVAKAVAICADCPVTDECLHYALRANEKHGIFGGKTERQRRVLRRERGLTDAPAVPHGTRTRYNGYGCRCASCKAANVAYNKKLRAT